MLSVGALAFLNPWLLAALVALPALWFLLRAIPPSPRRLAFPGVRLLLGLEDPERTPDRTPWWLLLLRCLIAAAAILAFAQPVLNPRARLSGSGPVLLLMDAGWASAADWEARRGRALDLLDQADRAGRPVIFAALARPLPEDSRLDARPAADWRGEIEALRPSPWAPAREAFATRLAAMQAMPFAETVWLTDGLAHGDGDTLADALADAGPLAVIGPEALTVGLRAPDLQDGLLGATVLRAEAGAPESFIATAFGTSETGSPRRLGQAVAAFEEGDTEARAAFDLPLELRNRVERVVLSGLDSAGAVALADDGVRRRRAALVAGGTESEGQQLVSDLHYLRTALEGRAELVEGPLPAALDSNPDVIFLADVGRFTEAESTALTDWIEAGGLLVRFAGPRLARGSDALSGGLLDDPLLPVRLRAGGRAVGGAMAWETPQGVRPFPPGTPFAGLSVADEVRVSRQILAQLGPDLPQRTWAALADGTPLVTAESLGAGRVVLFHVTANAEWSSLPLSGLFVDMLGRLLQIAGGTGGPTDRTALEGGTARPLSLIDGFGRIADAVSTAGVPYARLEEPASPEAPPGLYAVGETVIAHNLLGADDTLAPMAPPPAGVAQERLGGSGETPLGSWLLGLAVVLLALDTVATLALSGRLPRAGRRRGAAAALLLAAVLALGQAPGPTLAQTVDEATALRATVDTVLAYVMTGDATVDRFSAAGLTGLSNVLTARTAIEPAEPIGVNLETDEIAFFPVLYWPITPRQPTPSDEAIARINTYLRTGGMIIFDTRDRNMAFGTALTPNAEALRRIAGRLDLPALEPVPPDHVLTRTFFLLDSFPGRFTGGRVWVEATPPADPDAAPGEAELRNANDGVSPVIVGDADWSAAWAVDEAGQPLAPISGGDAWRQREMAYRFGVNAVMYALTGNYKSDQVHVPALLERLGQ